MSDPTKPKFTRGIRLKPDNLPLEGLNGEIKVDSVDNKIKTTLGGSAKEILTNDQVQSLTNKTIDVDNNTVSNIEVDNLKAGVLNVNISTGSPTDTEIPSAKAVRDYVDAKTDAQNEASEISFDPAGTIVATNVQDMGEELDGDIQGHINEVTGAHAASAIASTPSGNLAATDVQGALNELQSDVDTRALDSALTDHINDSTDAHDASAISVLPTGNLAADDVQEALEELQTDIDGINASGYVVGPASSGADAIARFDGSSGKLLKNSSITIDDTGLITANAGAANLGGTQIIGSKITGVGGTLQLEGSSSTGIVQVDKKLSVPNKFTIGGIEDNTSTGSNVTLSNPNAGYVRLKNSGLVSIDMIDSTLSNGQVIIISNQTGNPVTINNSTGATSANQIVTGTGGPITLLNEASILLRYDGGTTSRWTIVGGSGSGGGQSLDTIFQLTGMDFSQWVSGNNATFLGGGTLQGVFASETAAPLNGISSYKYTQTASPGSLNDYIASPIQTVPLRFRGQTNTVVFPFTYNGSNNDIVPVMYDVTNSAIIFGSVNNDGYALLGTNGGVKNYQANFIIPLSCTQVRFGFQVKAFSASAVLQFDDIEVGKDAVINVPMPENQNYVATLNSTMNATPVKSKGSGLFSVSTVSNRIRFTALKSVLISATGTINFNVTTGGAISTWYLNSSTTLAQEYDITNNVNAYTGTTASVHISLEAGEFLEYRGEVYVGGTFVSSQVSVLATATSDNIISPTESFSTDTAQLTYAPSSTYTLSTLANAPVGTLISRTGSSSSFLSANNTTTAPSQTTNSMNVDGILITTKAYNAASVAATPSYFAIQIGKGFKGNARNFVSFYKTTGKPVIMSDDSYALNANTEFGIAPGYLTYDPTTGVLQIDAGGVQSSANAQHLFQFNDGSSQTSAYMVINASKSPALTGVPALIPRIATLSDVKASGTNGGSLVNATWNTRTINTVSDYSGVVSNPASFSGSGGSNTSLVLDRGMYEIEVDAFVFFNSGASTTNQSMLRLANLTTGGYTYSISNSYLSTGTADVRPSRLDKFLAILEVSSTNTFEIQQYINQGGGDTSNKGRALSLSGINETYLVCKITKIK